MKQNMIAFIKMVMPFISGLYTLPWILVGFVVSMILLLLFRQEQIDFVMKKIGLIILYFFVPPLVFRIFLDTKIGILELEFVGLALVSIGLMYYIAYLYANYQAKKHRMNSQTKTIYIKTVITNQGRSSAFVGGAMLAIEGWEVPAGIFMALMGITLFAVVPYVLNHLNQKEQKTAANPGKLPWFLRIYSWYFISFVVAAVILQKSTGIKTSDMGDWGIILRFYTALTIPAALYYVGSGIHPHDLKKSELQKLIGIKADENVEHWQWVRQIFLLTTVITPALFAIIFGALYAFRIIPVSWLAVTIVNVCLPITSTNIFLVPYGLDKRATVHTITWSTLVSVPIAVTMIWLLSVWTH